MFIRRDKVTTRVDHECWGCCETIPAGSKSCVNVEAEDGKIFSVYFCMPCIDYMEENNYDDGVSQGDVGFDRKEEEEE